MMFFDVLAIGKHTTRNDMLIHLIDAMCVWIFDRYELVHDSKFRTPPNDALRRDKLSH